MAVTINLVTFSGQTVTPKDDAIIYDSAIAQCGIFYGCSLSASGNVISIDGGYGMIRGRFFEISASTETVTLASSGTLKGRIYIRLDLSNTSAPIQVLTETASTLSTLTQEDDANYSDGVWEMELATFNISTSEISDFTETYDTISDSATLIEALQTQITSLEAATLRLPLASRQVSVTGITDNTAFTASRSGWFVVTCTSISGIKLAPYLEIRNTNSNLASSWGVTSSGAVLRASCPVKQGQTYYVHFVRCSFTGAYIYY